MENILKIAEEIAREAHEGQERWGGEPYITHPEKIASKFNSDLFKSVAWLHDILEDTDLQPEDLVRRGIPKVWVQSVINLTRLEGEDYINYILKVSKDKVAIKIKIEDLKHNLKDLKKGSMRDKYLLALYILEEVI